MANKTKNQLRYIKQNMYDLKRRYGLPLDIYHNVINTINTQTGQRTETKIIHHIKRALVLPLTLALKNYMGGTGAFTMANYEVGDKLVVVDFRDLPDNYIITLTDYIIVQNIRYKLLSIEDSEINQSLRIIMREVKGQLPNEIHEIVARSKIIISQNLGVISIPNNPISLNIINNLAFEGEVIPP